MVSLMGREGFGHPDGALVQCNERSQLKVVGTPLKNIPWMLFCGGIPGTFNEETLRQTRGTLEGLYAPSGLGKTWRKQQSRKWYGLFSIALLLLHLIQYMAKHTEMDVRKLGAQIHYLMSVRDVQKSFYNPIFYPGRI